MLNYPACRTASGISSVGEGVFDKLPALLL